MANAARRPLGGASGWCGVTPSGSHHAPRDDRRQKRIVGQLWIRRSLVCRRTPSCRENAEACETQVARSRPATRVAVGWVSDPSCTEDRRTALDVEQDDTASANQRRVRPCSMAPHRTPTITTNSRHTSDALEKEGQHVYLLLCLPSRLPACPFPSVQDAS